MIGSDRLAWPSGRLGPGCVVVANGRIEQVREGEGWRQWAEDRPTVVSSGIVTPGLVDTHVHGGAGCLIASEDGAEGRRAVDFHHHRGTTALFASVATAEPTRVLARLRAASELCREGLIEGIHLEALFLSQEQRGAHPVEHLRDPDPGLLEDLLEAGGGFIKMVTLAPERSGALDAIDLLVGRGVRVAIGHTAADPSVVDQAVGRGATIATHLYNAMRPIHHRVPGPIPSLLLDPQVVVELIADGVHLSPEAVRMAVRAVGESRFMLITDASAAAGLPDGTHDVGHRVVEVENGMARIVVNGMPGAVAGSTATLSLCVANAIGMGVQPEAAILAATGTPARTHGLADCGALRVGARADLVLFDDDLLVDGVMRSGVWLSRPGHTASWSADEGT